MEKEPNTEHIEAREHIETILDGLYEREGKLFKKYTELFGEPSEKLRDWEFAVGMGAIVSLDTEQAREDIEEFIAFLEEEITKKSGADKA